MPNINCSTKKPRTEALTDTPVITNATIEFPSGCGLPKGKSRVRLVANQAFVNIPVIALAGTDPAAITALNVRVTLLTARVNQLIALLN